MSQPSEADAATTPLLPAYMTIAQFAKRSTLSETTVYRRVHDGSLPFVQAGGKGKKILIPTNALRSATPVSTTCDRVETPEVAVPPLAGNKPRKRRGPRAKWRRPAAT